MSLKDIVEPSSKPYGHQYADRKEQGYNIISPSGIKNFYTDIKTWKTNVIDGERTFFGNEATKLGDIVHKYAEAYRKDELTKEGKLKSIEVDKILSSTTDVDIKTIYQHYPLMCTALREHYLEVYPSDVESEAYMEYELEDKVLVAGTIDEVDKENLVLTDFKTSKSPYKGTKEIIPHFMQLCVYAALLDRLNGIQMKRIRIVNIARPTKTIGARVTILECDADIEYGAKLINETYQAILLCRNSKELLDILFKDNPLDGFTSVSQESADAYANKYIKNFTVITQEENKVLQVKKNIFA